ncbi:SipW-dependent-type signal peptide-containing protein [Halomontanus rarus]|uniref:SipW-dependent-type signal peptide-containing protein n=1 Tax=Halomontanus rarus TaxID=3034020 RepID=UPI0023E7DD79|nr:SipW-dependent-type signal peptide-containing protein [Halovivax sp. TS33]
MTKQNQLNLSRRKMLAGVGIIGVASAGAGLGTTAYFSDEETFENNTITAGEFGLTVEQAIHNVDQDGMGPDEEEWDAESDDDGVWVTAPINIVDAKPGDEYEFCWDLTVHDNPGYAMVTAENVEHLDGSETDAELSADDLHDTDELSTLGEAMDAEIVVYDSDGNEVSRVDYENLESALASLEGGLPVTDDETLIQIDPEETVRVCIELSIDTSVGNEIQGASTSTDLVFYAEQARHNDEFGTDD